MTTRAWQCLVGAPSLPDDPRARRALAQRASTALEALAAALVETPDESKLQRLLQGSFPGQPPPTPDALHDPRHALQWLWPLWTRREGPELSEVLGPEPPYRFSELVTDGRSDFVDLAPERPDTWVHLHQFGDGHQDLFWDTSFDGGLRVLHTDNREPDPVVRVFESAPEFLLRWFLPELVSSLRPALADELKSERRGNLEGFLLLAGLAGLVLGTIVVLGGLLRACGGS